MDDARIAEIRLRITTFAEECEHNCLAPADIRDLLAEVERLRENNEKLLADVIPDMVADSAALYAKLAEAEYPPCHCGF